jgi:S-adenosylmethionine-dependent methyltransferase
MGKSLGNREGSDDIATRYDTLAREYDERFQSGYREEIQNAIIFSTLREFLDGKKCRVLDAGGGTGFYSIPLAVQGHEVVILDLSKSMLEMAEAKAKRLGVANRVEILLGDMESIEQPDESFDVVLCHLALCHVDDPSEALAEFSRVLRRDGILSIVVENKMFFSISEAFKGNILEALERLKKERLFVATDKLGTFRTFERQELLTLFEQTKLKPTRTLGLRVISDYLFYAQKAPPDDVETLKELELLLSKSPDWNSIGRFHLFICRKP